MTTVRIIALAVFVGFVAAGFAWYGIGLFQNIKAMRGRGAEGLRPDTASVDEDGEPGEDELV